MGNSSKFILCCLIVILLLHQAISTTPGNGCANRSSKWKDLGGDFCYIIEENIAVSWIDAVYQCFREGGSLASFHSIAEVERVVDNVDDEKKRFYIGLHRNSKGGFEWVDKSALDFTNWYPGEPNYDFEKCVEIYIGSDKWNDVDCSNEWGYVCSSPKYQPPREHAKVCPRTSWKWEDLGGDACYIIEKENKVTWSDALRRCFEEGGFLASFHSVGEISAVLQRIKHYHAGYHIGLRKNDSGIYEWADGSVVDFDYWGTAVDVHSWDIDVPEDAEEECSQMYGHNGRWSPVYCERLSDYICSTPKVAHCGGDIVATAGLLQSPHYPQPYEPGEKCVWNIRAPENYRIFLKFRRFDIESSFNCMKDYLEIRDDHNETDYTPSMLPSKVCGPFPPDGVYSSGNTLTVVFESDLSTEGVGFSAEFEADICGGDTYADTGILASPKYKRKYRKNENCVWNITVPENHQIIVKFEVFDLEGSNDCGYDFVEIRDGHKSDSPVLDKFCSTDLPDPLRSTTNKIAVKFVSDYSDEREGFVLSFEKDVIRSKSVEFLLQEISGSLFQESVRNAKARIL